MRVGTFAYFAIAFALGCSVTSSAGGALTPFTECSNVLGIDYRGVGDYDPPLMPALLAGLVAAALTAMVLHRLLTRRRMDA